MTVDDHFLALSAATGRFSYGAPRAFSFSADGERLLLLRSAGPRDAHDRLWQLDLTTGQEHLLADPAQLLPGRTGDPADLPPAERRLRERTRLFARGIGSFAATPDGHTAVFALDGRLFRARREGVEPIPAAGPVFDPRPNADGSAIAYVCADALHLTGREQPLSPADGARWGVAEFAAAEELGRHRGHWWAPDGRAVLAARVDESALPLRHFADPAHPDRPAESFAYPQAGGPNADVQLWVLGLDGMGAPPAEGWGRVRLDWDAESYPYVCAADWDESGEILLTVADRLQQRVLLLGADPATGKTVELSRTEDACWVDDLPGTPARLPGGALLTSADTPDGAARALALDGRLLTPADVQVRRVVGRLGGRLLIEATDGDPADQQVLAVDPADGSLERLTAGPGLHCALAAGESLLLISTTPDGTSRRVLRAGRAVELADLSEPLPYPVRPRLARLTELGLPSAVVFPRDHRAGERLPVLLDVYGGPGFQAVVNEPRRWQLRQWWADQGFAVVTVDNRGTPFVSPAFSKAVFRGFSQVTLDDQVAGLLALGEREPDLDLGRVAVRGWSYGGYLAAMAVLRRPDLFHAASAGAGPTDFRTYDTAYTERYLGLPQEHPEVYQADCLLPDAPSLSRPLLLIHGLADDNVHPSHTLRLSAALHAAGRPHSVLPLPGISHLTPEGSNELMVAAELAFLRSALGL